MSLTSLPHRLLAAVAPFIVACGVAASNGEVEADQTSFRAPADGSCEATAMLRVANESSGDTLEESVGLSHRAAEAIVAARPIASVAALDAVSQVGPAALTAILAFTQTDGGTIGCSSGNENEIGVMSDLDDTVIPAATPDLSKAPFPGIKALYELLEHHDGGKSGDVYYVTARSPDRIVEVPAYLAANGMMPGPIETGVSGVPAIARPEKVRDIEQILDRTKTQRFVFFGDTSNVDPEVQRDILAAHPERMVVGIIHKTTETIDPARIEGLRLVEDYAEAAAVLARIGVITRDEALAVMRSARDGGLAITDAKMSELLATP